MQQEKVKKNFTTHDLIHIQPLNPRQEDAFHNFYNYDINSLLGAAGTGKSLVACYLALKSIADRNHKKLLIVRSAVPTRDVGFLPGTLEEKSQVYEMPYQGIFNQLLDYKSKNYENMKELQVVAFETTSYLRGLTYDNTIILAEECQNFSFQELDTVMTRVGENSKLILCGDGNQADLHHNGLGQFLSIIERMPEYAGVEFTVDDVVRSGLVKSYLKEKYL